MTGVQTISAQQSADFLWRRGVPNDVAYHRAGGRRADNADRKRQASVREEAAIWLLLHELGFRRGAAAEVARGWAYIGRQ